MKVADILGIICVMAVGSTTSCKKDRLVYDEVPEIRLVSASPVQLQQFTDSVTVKMEYTDGNGDLGFLNADSFALEVKDSRLSQPDYYYVPPLAPLSDENIPVTGILTFRLNGTFLIGSGNSETIIYSIRIKDRAGHWSNTIETPAIVITK